MAFSESSKIEKKEPVYVPRENREKGKGNIALIASAIIVLVIVGGMYLLLKGQKPTEPYSPALIDVINETILNKTELCEDDCLFTKAVTSLNYSICNEIINESKKESCFLQLSSLSLESCVNVKNYTKKKECVLSHALFQKSTEICNNLKVADRKQCIETIDPCFYKVLTEKSLCLATLHKNYSYCQDDYECIYQYAEMNSDKKACDMLDSKVSKQLCINLVDNLDKCHELVLASQVDYCKQLYAIRASKPSVCADISSDTSYSYECYSHFAVKEKNKDYCQKLSLEDKWKCYKKYSLATYDASGCVQISEYAPNAKNTCYSDVAVNYHNASFCEGINNPSEKLTCYSLAIGIEESIIYPKENCAGVNILSWKDRCYRELAQRTKNMTLCDYVMEEGIKKLCIITVGSTKAN